MQREMSKSKATFLIFLSGRAAVISALGLHGLALALIGVAMAVGFIRWSRKN